MGTHPNFKCFFVDKVKEKQKKRNPLFFFFFDVVLFFLFIWDFVKH